jgi:hypothetical protein
MANTTNFNWETPDDTDLVKDGAAAMRTLGNSIDTTTKALNPSTTLGDIEYRSATANTNTRLPIGTTGQVLAVVGGVPAWATTADQTPLTTKGDIFTFTTVDARLGVGANGTVLTADSAEATGLKWVAPAVTTPTYVGSFVYNSTDQNVTNNTYTALTYNTEFFDTDSFHSTSSNTSRMTIPTGKGGYYQVYGAAAFGASTTGDKQLFIRKNNTDIFFSGMGSYNQGRNNVFISGTINCAAGDYLEIFAYQNSGGTLDVGGGTRFNFGVDYLGA